MKRTAKTKDESQMKDQPQTNEPRPATSGEFDEARRRDARRGLWAQAVDQVFRLWTAALRPRARKSDDRHGQDD